MKRDILHINITAFPIGVERVVDWSLRDRPVVIAAPNSPRSVVMALSREAYLEGVIKGMPVSNARKFCRGLVVIPPNEPLYRRASRAIFRFVSNYSPLIEPWRAGHIYLDISGTRKLFGSPPDIGARIQREIKAKFSLRNTVGLASNKLVSMVASRVVRPRGLCDVFPGGEATFLSPLEVDVLPSVGPKTLILLSDLNISMVGELAAISPDHLFMAFGNLGWRLHRYSRGIDESPVRPPEKAPSVREEETLAEDSNDDRVILGILYLMVERAGRRLRIMNQQAGVVKLEVIYSDHVSASRELRLAVPSDLDGPIFAEARWLLEKAWTRRIRLRYLCLTLKELLHQGPRQLSLFENLGTCACYVSPDFTQNGRTHGSAPTDNGGKERSLVSALDALRAKYGEKSVRYGLTM